VLSLIIVFLVSPFLFSRPSLHIQVVSRFREPTKSSSAIPMPMTDDEGGDNSEASNCMSEDEREVLPRPLPLISLVFCFPPFPSTVLCTSVGSTFHGDTFVTYDVQAERNEAVSDDGSADGGMAVDSDNNDDEEDEVTSEREVEGGDDNSEGEGSAERSDNDDVDDDEKSIKVEEDEDEDEEGEHDGEGDAESKKSGSVSPGLTVLETPYTKETPYGSFTLSAMGTVSRHIVIFYRHS